MMKNENTNNSKIKLEEQEAPLKNTDNAFVKVNRDGSPEMPEVNKDEEGDEEERGKR